MDQLITDRLRDNLQRLKLTQAAAVLDTVLLQAETDKSSYMAFLDHLLEEEVGAKEKRRVETAMKTAGLPAAKTIDAYDFSFHPDLNKKDVMALFDLDFIPKHENVIFLGPPGVGKTHSGDRIGHQGLSSRLQGLFHDHGRPDAKTEGAVPVPAQGLSDLQSGGGR